MAWTPKGFTLLILTELSWNYGILKTWLNVGQTHIFIKWNGMNIHLTAILGFTKYQGFE
jgi:hypothetical protein